MDKLREAVEHLLNTCPPIDASGEEAHARARAALAEPVADEPVAWRYRYKDRGNWLVSMEKPAFLPAVGFECEPLYTRPAPAPAELLQHGDKRLTARHYRTRATVLKPVR